MQMSGGGKAVACVVAHAADHGRALADKPGDLPSRSLHQPLDRDAETLFAERVDLPDLAAAKSR